MTEFETLLNETEDYEHLAVSIFDMFERQSENWRLKKNKKLLSSMKEFTLSEIFTSIISGDTKSLGTVIHSLSPYITYFKDKTLCEKTLSIINYKED